MISASTITDEDRARFEAARRAEEARLEYGRTLDDVRHLLKRAKFVRLWVRRNRDDAFIFDTTKAAFLKETTYLKGTDAMPCEFDPEERRLTIGSWRAIYKSEERS